MPEMWELSDGATQKEQAGGCSPRKQVLWQGWRVCTVGGGSNQELSARNMNVPSSRNPCVHLWFVRDPTIPEMFFPLL